MVPRDETTIGLAEAETATLCPLATGCTVRVALACCWSGVLPLQVAMTVQRTVVAVLTEGAE
jgi:hypothetical protein